MRDGLVISILTDPGRRTRTSMVATCINVRFSFVIHSHANSLFTQHDHPSRGRSNQRCILDSGYRRSRGPREHLDPLCT